MSIDPLMVAADRVTYCLAEDGYAFVEDDQVAALAEALRAFLEGAGIAVAPGAEDGGAAG